MTETVETKEQRLQKLREKQQALLDRAKAVAKRIERAESATKAKRRKNDDRTKLLIGVALLEQAQTSPQLQRMIQTCVKVLKPRDRTFLTEQSELWSEFEKMAKEAESNAPKQP